MQAGETMIDRAAFRSAMARLSAAVTIITTDGPAGLHGMTASAVCSVTDDPAILLVCINRASRMHDAIVGNGRLCVNVLAAAQQSLSGSFADRTLAVEERFGSAQWTVLRDGGPALDGALVSMACDVDQVRAIGTHSVFFCRVVALRQTGSNAGLVYFDRAYHHLPAAGLTS